MLPKLPALSMNKKKHVGILESPSRLADQGVIAQLSEQISTLNERMDDFTSQIVELNSRLTIRKNSSNHQNLGQQAEACNGSESTSLFIAGLGNGSLLPNSSSSSPVVKEYPSMEEIMVIVRGQRQIMHRIDNLISFIHENYWGERHHEINREKRSRTSFEIIGVPLFLTLAIGGVGIFLFKGLSSRN